MLPTRTLIAMKLPEIPSSLREFVFVAELDTALPFATALFQRKFGTPPPDFGKHFTAWVRAEGEAFQLASYVNMWERDGSGYLGGGATDGAVLRALPAAQQAAINEAGGLYVPLAKYVFQKYATTMPVIYGYCGDEHAFTRHLQAGFVRVPNHPHLMTHFNWSHTPAQQAALIAIGDRVGAF
jgi:hypothetical protein